MAALVAKRYVKALLDGENAKDMAAISAVFDALAAQFENGSFVDFISAPDVNSSVKEEILLAAVEKAKKVEKAPAKSTPSTFGDLLKAAAEGGEPAAGEE